MSNPWFYHYQRKGGEDTWVLSMASAREKDQKDIKPAFVTVLDLSDVPADNDWSKVRYKGCLYFDFDADGDLDLACDQFTGFLDKLHIEFGFDINQARLYLSGGKGMHIEIPQECFMPKLPPAGTPWLPYVYKAMAESVVVDTMDTLVYTGKRGRMWRTPNVQRDSGTYKVSISVEEALSITPELYLQLVSEPRDQIACTPPSCNTKLALLFNASREKVMNAMRGRKKRQAMANVFLDPWKAAKKTPPTIDALMRGENIAEGAGFQQIALQLAIYATSVGMSEDEFLERCRGVCENHVSDSRRYDTFAKRRAELSRLWAYCEENTFYDFALGPIIKLVARGVSTPDLGVMETEDTGDAPPAPAVNADGTPVEPDDVMKAVRKGFSMNAQGMFKRVGDITDTVCRATLRKVTAFKDLETNDFRGYEFDLVVKDEVIRRSMLDSDTFTSALKMKQFFAKHQISYQGGEPETTALLDIMAEKASRNGHIYTYPREGLFLVKNPTPGFHDQFVKVYLTQEAFISSVPEGDDGYFRMRYKPDEAMSSYRIDIHKAPDLDESMIPILDDLFMFSADKVVADTVGWFIAALFKSFYLEFGRQFPHLQVYGEAGAGKTQTVTMLAAMHWFNNEIPIISAGASTPFALDSSASTSTSAPMILDEYKPRVMDKKRLEKLREMFRVSYNGNMISNKGTLNKGAESPLSVVRKKATAPICMMGEAIEMETAIFERCICVNLNKDLHTKERTAAFERLQANPQVLSALGRALAETALAMDLDEFKRTLHEEVERVRSKLPENADSTIKKMSARLVFNRAALNHAWKIAGLTLNRSFGSLFDDRVQAKVDVGGSQSAEEARTESVMGMSEMSKVISRIATLSRETNPNLELLRNKDYTVGDGWVELRVGRGYDQYRKWCASINEVPLFDSLEVFAHALMSYFPVMDRFCASSVLREDGNAERIVRLNSAKLIKEGVTTFKP